MEGNSTIKKYGRIKQPDIDNAEREAGDDCNKNVRVLILDPHCVINLIKGEYNN